MAETNFDNQIHDDEIARCVKELMRNSRANYSQVQVTVDAGNVHFSGTLDNEMEREHLNEMVKMVQGTGSVINDVTLRH